MLTFVLWLITNNEGTHFLEIRVKNIQGKPYVFDYYRMKWVAATPEEKVRQTFCAYLVEQLHYPQTAIANECTVCINGQHQRCDTIVYKGGNPFVVLEYKAPTVEITQAVFDQILRYNTSLHVPYLVVTNQRQTYFCKLSYDPLQAQFLAAMPEWDAL